MRSTKLFSLIIFFATATLFYCKAQMNPLVSNLTIEQGLSNNGVTCILQDHYGFLWFGTWDGLNKYNGKKITNFIPQTDLKSGLSNNNISCLFEDCSKMMWIGTKSNGLNRMNLSNNKIESFADTCFGIEASWITDVNEDFYHNVWVSTDNGIYVLDSTTRNAPALRFKKILGGLFVWDLETDNRGNVWFASNAGLYFYSGTSKRIHSLSDYLEKDHLLLSKLSSIAIDKEGVLWLSGWVEGLMRVTFNQPVPEQNNGLPAFFTSLSAEKIDLNEYIRHDEFKGVYRLFVDSHNNLWAILWGKGLLRRNASGKFDVIRHSKKTNASISNNYVLSVYEDKSGLFWAGTDDGGVNKIDVNSKPFYIFSEEFGDEFGRIGPIIQTSDHKLLVGTRDAGLYTATFDSKNFELNPGLIFHPFPISQNRSNAVSYREITCLFEDSKHNIWIGTTQGLNLMASNQQFHPGTPILKYFLTSKNQQGLSDDNITHVAEDSNGTIWVGTMNNGINRLDSIDPEYNLYFTRFLPLAGDSSSLSHFRIRTIFKDKEGAMWVGTDCGLNLLMTDPLTLSHSFKTVNSGNSNLSNNSIICINEDVDGNLWIGTTSRLNMLPREQKFTRHPQFIVWGMKDGLPSDFILSVLFDQESNAWITTNGGLVKINRKTNVLNVYNKSDGFLGNVFSEESGFKNSDGYFFLGDIKGLNVFNPARIKQTNYIPNVCLVSLFSGTPEAGEWLNPDENNSILDRKSIELRYDQRNFSIEFVSLCFISPEKNQYQYYLDGFENDWINSGNRNIASYTNIPPGRYTMKVKGSNGNGVWNPKESSISIRIKSPWWFSGYAFIIYALIIFLLVYSLTRVILLQEKLKNQIIIDMLEKEKIEELNKAKLKFFTNISHEFRTPLTIILLILKNLKNKFGNQPEELKTFGILKKNTNILLRLVNQILDIRKMESDMMIARPVKTDIIQFLRQIYEALIPLADEKQIQYVFESGIECAVLYFDQPMMEKVFWNILANAFRYTPERGTISIRISLENKPEYNSPSGFIQVSIKDNGPGIPADELPRIFDRFYQAGIQNSSSHRGTGIGLSIAKEMVEINKGLISVTSSEDAGTVFNVCLPFENTSFEQIEKAESKDLKLHVDTEMFFADIKNIEGGLIGKTRPINDEKPLLLIVEDNTDLLLILRESLAYSFQIETALNGREGLDIAIEIMPDIIVSDIAIPEIDGLTLCRRLKTDIKTSHIPIILLSAKATVEQQLAGLETNADDYITKPFDLKILEARIKNLIRERRYLREIFRKDIEIDTEKLELNATDKRFIDKALKIVEKNIADENYSIDNFSEHIGMSRSSLYRKIEALTGQSPKEFIRNIRIKKAAKLLLEGNHTISEVAFEVGFISRSYFTKCFTEQFGMLPSKYMETKGKKAETQT